MYSIPSASWTVGLSTETRKKYEELEEEAVLMRHFILENKVEVYMRLNLETFEPILVTTSEEHAVMFHKLFTNDWQAPLPGVEWHDGEIPEGDNPAPLAQFDVK